MANKPYVGYGTNKGAGKKITSSVKKNVKSGVAAAGRARGRAAATGAASKSYTKTERGNRGTAWLSDKVTSFGKTVSVQRTGTPLDSQMRGGPYTASNNKRAGGLGGYGGRVGNPQRLKSKSLYERKAAQAYIRTKAKKK